MSINVSYEIFPTYIYARLCGSNESGDGEGAIEEVFQRAFDEGRFRILLDAREVFGPAPDTLQRFNYGVLLAQLQLKMQVLGLAIVGNAPIVEPQRFAETVGRNRGANMRVFTDFDEALIWIKESAEGCQ